LISRKAMASPATGYAKVHKEEQANIVKEAFKK
jgi:2-oxoglutarate dehydrogenase E1 component